MGYALAGPSARSLNACQLQVNTCETCIRVKVRVIVKVNVIVRVKVKVIVIVTIITSATLHLGAEVMRSCPLACLVKTMTSRLMECK